MRLRKVNKKSIYWKSKNIIPLLFVFVVISVVFVVILAYVTNK